MCGRYSFVTAKQKLEKQLQIHLNRELQTSYNIAPTHFAPVIINDANQPLRYFNWGLIPHWSRDGKLSGKLINARKEGIATKPSFRMPIRQKRCLVPADSFYEWRPYGKKKVPYRICMRDDSLMMMAGIWDEWKLGDEIVRSFSIITTTPNNDMQLIHNRMPVIFLEKEKQQQWLSDISLDEVMELMQTPADNSLRIYRVSEMVNSVKSNSPHLHQEVIEPPTLFD